MPRCGTELANRPVTFTDPSAILLRVPARAASLVVRQGTSSAVADRARPSYFRGNRVAPAHVSPPPPRSQLPFIRPSPRSSLRVSAPPRQTRSLFGRVRLLGSDSLEF